MGGDRKDMRTVNQRLTGVQHVQSLAPIQVNRAPLVVDDGRRGVHSKRVVDCRPDIVRVIRSRRRVPTVLVAFADHLPTADSAAGKHRCVAWCPVAAARNGIVSILGDTRRTTKFTHQDDRSQAFWQGVLKIVEKSSRQTNRQALRTFSFDL